VKLGSRVKAFVATPPGKIALAALATGAIVTAFPNQWAYLGFPIAIAAFLFAMLVFPIYLGWNRPRELAVVGLVVLLVGAPLGALAFTPELRLPVGPVSSPTVGNGSVIENAQSVPFTGDAGTTFDFQATINPQYLPTGARAPEYSIVYLTTCPDTVIANDSACGGGGYPFWVLSQTFATNLTQSTQVNLEKELNDSTLWYWEMAFVFHNATNSTLWVWLGSGLAYSNASTAPPAFSVQGPISGSFTSTFEIVLPGAYEAGFLYFGTVFYGALVIYLWVKSRQNRRNPPAAPGPSLPGSAPPGAPVAGAPRIERSCPKCGAVVYPEEKACWKCGAPLGNTGTPATPSPPLS
jgi:hypothetical protein